MQARTNHRGRARRLLGAGAAAVMALAVAAPMALATTAIQPSGTPAPG